MRVRTRLAAAAAGAAALAAGYLVTTQFAGAQEADGFADQDIAWHDCRIGIDDEVGEQLDEAGAQCGEVVVPLDYRDPAGRVITVAVSRLPAADDDERVGAMLLNNGGPGGTGLDAPLLMMERSQLRERFDLVGVDPRFIGRSQSVDCEWATGSYVRSPGDDRESFDETAEFQAELAEKCERAESDVLPYITTRNTARDFDVVRSALDETKVSYVGYSYGTYLGSVYAQMFPDRVDRMVLDGPVDPKRYGATMFADSAGYSESGLTEWAGWAAEHDAEYGLGDSTETVLSTVDEILAAGRAQPLRLGDYEIDSGLLPLLLSDLLADDRDEANALLTDTVVTLAEAADNGAAEPSQFLAQTLAFLTTSAESTYGSAQVSVLCGDVDVPSDPDHYWEDIAEHAADEPRMGAQWRNISPCAFWPVEPVEPVTEVDSSVDALVVAATKDPATPYTNADPLREALGDDSRLVSLDARVHGVYNTYGDDCVDDTVTRYLTSGDIPESDTDCPGS